MKKKFKWYILAMMFFLCLVIIPFTLSKYVTTIRSTITLNARQPEYDVVFNPNKNTLPSGYTELEYIEGTGTQYILTNIVPTDTTGINMSFKFYDNASDKVYFGSGNTTNDDGYWFGSNNSRGYFRWDVLYSGAQGNTPYIIVSQNQLLNVQMNYQNNRELIVDDTIYFSGLPTLGNKTAPLTIFGYNNDTTNTISLIPKMQLYNFKVSNGTTIIADFIPCFRNSDGKPGVYDVVGNAFYTNQGTGEFTKGYVTQHFIYGTAQNLEANTYQRNAYAFTHWNTSPDGTGTSYNDVELVNNLTEVDGDIINLYAIWENANTIYNFYPNRLAPGYVELDYIEGTGTQYITTDVIPTDSTGVQLKMTNKDSTNNLVYFGCGTAQNDGFWIGNNGGRFYTRFDTLYTYNNGGLPSTSTMSNNVRYTFALNYLNDRTLKRNTTTFVNNLPTLSSKTGPITIFGYYNPNDDLVHIPGKYQLYEFKISQVSNVIRNYVPCYRMSDGEAGLYETINGVFYPSESEESFIKGPEIKTTQKIYYNTSANLNANTFTNEGYIFKNWNTEQDGTGTSYTDEQLITNNNPNSETINLYAQWEKSNLLYDVLKTAGAYAAEYTGEGNLNDTNNPFFTNHIYYWRPTNNIEVNTVLDSWNVVFAGSCWQMIRTTESEGVKLLYNGEPEIGESNGETTYDCSDNRNLYHMGGIESTYSISGSKVYADSYTATTSGTTTTFTLVNSDESTPTTKTITSGNASEVIGMYTCGNTSTTCTNTSLRKIVSISSGTTANVYTSTYRDVIGMSVFNNTNSSPAALGYMYNEYTAVRSYSGNTETTINGSSNTATLNATTLGWYFSDTMKSGSSARTGCSDTEGQNSCYTLGGTPQLGSAIVDPTSSGTNDYSKLVGKYTMKNTNAVYGTTSNVRSIYYVVGYDDTTLYMLQISENHPLSYYQKTYNLSKTYSNGSLQSSVQVKNFVTPDELVADSTSWERTWPKVYSTYNNQNYYVCPNGTDTCTPYYVITTNWYQFTYYNTVLNNFSNTISYDTSTNKYTIDMNDTNATSFWDFTQTTNTNKLVNAHYVCLDDTNHYPIANSTECTWVGYVYYVYVRSDNTTIYYMPLSGGQYISTDTSSTTGMTKWADENNLLYMMLYEPNVNNTNSTIKGRIDKWYENNILGTPSASKIDTKEIYCKDRRTTNNFGSWNANSTNMTTYLNFSQSKINGNINCPVKTDAFSKDATTYGNGALIYPIGLMSASEMYLLTGNSNSSNLRKSSQAYWLGSSGYFGFGSAYGGSMSTNGSIGNADHYSNSRGIRPAVSLVAGIEYEKGDGSTTNPYVVDLNSPNN